jgi:hypothetical protein
MMGLLQQEVNCLLRSTLLTHRHTRSVPAQQLVEPSGHTLVTSTSIKATKHDKPAIVSLIWQGASQYGARNRTAMLSALRTTFCLVI